MAGTKFLLYLDGVPLTSPAEKSGWGKPTKIELSDDERWLIWGGESKEAGVGPAQENLLADFLSLSEASPHAVLKFSRRWGVLGICRHGKPSTHLPRRQWSELEEVGVRPCGPMRTRGLAGARREPVARWHHFAAQARSIHAAAGALLSGRRVADSGWQVMKEVFPAGWVLPDQEAAQAAALHEHPLPVAAGHVDREVQPVSRQRRMEDANEKERRLLTFAVQRWLDWGDVRPVVRWNGPGGTLTFGGSSLFGALALQLALTTTKVGGFFLCSACRRAYVPERRPRGERHFCAECHDAGVPGRLRAQRWRQSHGGDGSPSQA